jgi:hypothetical protein
METWFTTTPWPGLVLWTLLSLSDYWMTIKTVRLYRACPHFQFEGSLELNPQFEKDVDALRPVSRRHLLMLALTELFLLAIWGLYVLLEFTQGFAFILGMFILMEAGIHLRHLRSYRMLTLIRAKGGLTGTLSHRRWFLFANSAFEFFCLAVLFLFAALMTRSLFFAGGALGCLSLALNHYRKSRRLYKLASAAPPAPSQEGPTG